MPIYFSKTLSFVSNPTSFDLKLIAKTFRRKKYNASITIGNFKINVIVLNANIFPFHNNKMMLLIILNNKVIIIISFIPEHSNSKQSNLPFQPHYSYPQYSQYSQCSYSYIACLVT